jgi:hypothetical protein
MKDRKQEVPKVKKVYDPEKRKAMYARARERWRRKTVASGCSGNMAGAIYM